MTAFVSNVENKSTMVLYNIHTHTHTITQINDYYIRYIVNTFPLEYNDLRRQQPSAKVFSCGIHPWFSNNPEPQILKLKELACTENDIVAIGEAGIDKQKGPELSIQAQVFKTQAELSEEISKPLIIHCVKAWGEIISIKKEIKPKQPWIIHGFRGKRQLARQLIQQDFKISIGKYFNQEALKEIPVTSLFLETDNSESSIVTIYKNVAASFGIKMTELVSMINSNVRSTFKLTYKTSMVN